LKDVEGKVAFVTGGAGGIGLALAQVFVNNGMKVVIADIRECCDMSAHFPGNLENIHVIRLDVTDRLAMARAADEAEQVFGKLHVLCNNAGVNDFCSVGTSTYDDWDWVVGVNLGGVLNGLHAFIPKLKAHREGGHIVNTASMAAFIPVPTMGLYTASKFGVRGLTEALRSELGSCDIGVSLLCPGLVRTDIAQSYRVRPEYLGSTGSTATVIKQMARLSQIGMDPARVAERVLTGIKRNDAYIFSHPEFKAELKDLFNEILAAMPDDQLDSPQDVQRLAFENIRRQSKIRS
jgi:NAD(P)-dependent dehydrogenase (short-subunit alcohol dehydrogenase family)